MRPIPVSLLAGLVALAGCQVVVDGGVIAPPSAKPPGVKTTATPEPKTPPVLAGELAVVDLDWIIPGEPANPWPFDVVIDNQADFERFTTGVKSQMRNPAVDFTKLRVLARYNPMDRVACDKERHWLVRGGEVVFEDRKAAKVATKGCGPGPVPADGYYELVGLPRGPEPVKGARALAAGVRGDFAGDYTLTFDPPFMGTSGQDPNDPTPRELPMTLRLETKDGAITGGASWCPGVTPTSSRCISTGLRGLAIDGAFTLHLDDQGPESEAFELTGQVGADGTVTGTSKDGGTTRRFTLVKAGGAVATPAPAATPTLAPRGTVLGDWTEGRAGEAGYVEVDPCAGGYWIFTISDPDGGGQQLKLSGREIYRGGPSRQARSESAVGTTTDGTTYVFEGTGPDFPDFDHEVAVTYVLKLDLTAQRLVGRRKWGVAEREVSFATPVERPTPPGGCVPRP
jgi:hypothetical protein